MRMLLPLAALPLWMGCRNSCQQLCKDMADYAQDACGLEFSSDEVQSCIDDHKRSEVDADARQACTDAAPTLEEEWSCEDLEAYFNDHPTGS